MIIYNTTVKIEASLAHDWLQWLAEDQAPEMLATGFFTTFHVLQLLEGDESDGPTYAVQFYAASMADYEAYLAHHAEHFRQRAADKWGGDLLSFTTLMQVIV